MEGIVVIGVLVVIAGGLFAAGAWWTMRALVLRSEEREHDQAQAKADAAATWQVDVRHRGPTTRVVVQRTAKLSTGWRPLDEPVVVATIPQDSADYEVELEKAGAVARQRARQLNGFLDREGPPS